MMSVEKKKVRSFRDLDVYNESYNLMLRLFSEALPKLSSSEKFDLCDQLRRSSKAVPRLIAEGYSKRHQAKGFKRYLDDSLSESNETLVSICQVRDLYGSHVETSVCEDLASAYDKLSRQIYTLGVSWSKSHALLMQNFKDR